MAKNINALSSLGAEKIRNIWKSLCKTSVAIILNELFDSLIIWHVGKIWIELMFSGLDIVSIMWYLSLYFACRRNNLKNHSIIKQTDLMVLKQVRNIDVKCPICSICGF